MKTIKQRYRFTAFFCTIVMALSLLSPIMPVLAEDSDTSKLSTFQTNLQNIICIAPSSAPSGLNWTVKSNGIAMSGYNGGDTYGLADNKGQNFTVEADVTGTGAAAGIAIHCGNDPRRDCLIVQLDWTKNKARIIGIPFDGYDAEVDYALTPGQTYHLKVVSQNSNVKVYVNRSAEPIINYTSPTTLPEGRVALFHNRGDVVLQNVYFTTENGDDGIAITPTDTSAIKNPGFENNKRNI